MIGGMSTHIGAGPGQIAPRVLLPGDPLRARWIAETFLDDARCYSTVRNMLGFTGTYQGVEVSVQGSGMGMPSASIYAHELINEYGVRTLVRVGSCGALVESLALYDVVAAIGCCTDSAMNRLRFEGLIDYAPVADFSLLRTAVEVARRPEPAGARGYWNLEALSLVTISVPVSMARSSTVTRDSRSGVLFQPQENTSLRLGSISRYTPPTS